MAEHEAVRDAVPVTLHQRIQKTEQELASMQAQAGMLARAIEQRIGYLQALKDLQSAEVAQEDNGHG